MAKAPPAIELYYTNWVESTDVLSDKAYRVYLRLLIYQFQNGHIPKKPVQRMNLCHIRDLGEWQQVWDEIHEKFQPIESGLICDYVGDSPDEIVLVNPVMHEQREARLPGYKTSAKAKANRINGNKGGRPRKDRLPNLNPNETQTKPTDNPNETQTEPKKTHRGEKGEGKREDNTPLKEGNSSLEASARDDRDLAAKRPDRQTTRPPKPTEPAPPANEHEFVWTSTINRRSTKLRIADAHDTPAFRDALAAFCRIHEYESGKAASPDRLQIIISELATRCPDVKSATEALARSVTQTAKPWQVFFNELPARAPWAKFGAQEPDEPHSLPKYADLVAAGVIR
jgi:hypothetical protein